MDLFNLVAKLTLDSNDYNSGVGKAEGALSKLGGLAKKTGVAVAGTLTAAAGAVMGLTKSAVEAYSEYEQLVGGIETLYQSSVDEADSTASKVLERAQKAYETAGMSANDYMENVMNISASLIQSTGRGEQQDLEALKETLDEEYTATKRSLDDQYAERKSYWDEQIRLEKNKSKKQSLKEARDAELKELKRSNEDSLAELKRHNKEVLAEAEAANMSSETSEESLERAADLADQAMIDMSDNANKMGTDISAIQNAYAGFAKQNYTMLDNLKLGYGGTKEEMERLLADAEKITGKKYDISSYADIIEAIHAIQTEMGITGTTAEEAENTIEGSSKAMKAAWENMLVTFADKKGDTKKATQNLVRTAKNYYKNISPVITQAISGIGDFFSEIAPMIGEELPKIIVDVVPKMFGAGKKLISGLVKGAKSAVSKSKVATWLGMADENGNVPDDVSWGDIGRRVIERIKEKISEGKIKLADMLGIEDAEDATWGDIARNISGRIKEKLKGAKIKLASILGVDEPESATWGDIARNISGRIRKKLESAKIKLASLLGVDEPESASWSSIAIKLKTRLKEAISKLKVKLSDLLGLTKDGVGTEADWSEIGREIISKLTSYFSHKGDFLAKLILGDEFDKLGADENKWIAVGEKISGWLTEAFGDGGLINAILGNTTEKAEAIAHFAGELMTGIADWVGNNSGAIVNILTTIVSSITKVAPHIVNAITTILRDPQIWTAIGDLIKAVWQAIFGTPEENLNKNLFNGFTAQDFSTLQEYIDAFNEGRDKLNRLLELDATGQTDTEEYAKLQEEADKASKKVEELANKLEGIKSEDGKSLYSSYMTWFYENDKERNGKLLDIPTELIPDGTKVLEETSKGYDATLRLHPEFGTGDTIRPHIFGDNSDLHPDGFAKGLPTVPYDNFLANLHRGESVLTASQARDYREGNAGGIDIADLEARIESAIRRGMDGATVRSYLNGKDITDEVNRNNMMAVKGRRFAT